MITESQALQQKKLLKRVNKAAMLPDKPYLIN